MKLRNFICGNPEIRSAETYSGSNWKIVTFRAGLCQNGVSHPEVEKGLECDGTITKT